MSHENGIEIIGSHDKVGVLLPLIFRTPFDYRVPQGMEIKPGDYVHVPFGNKQVWGVVWGTALGSVDEKKIKPIGKLCAHLPPMSDAMRKFIDWVAWYTQSPAGQVLKMALSAPEALEEVVERKLRLAEGSDAKLTPARARIIAYMADNTARSPKEICEHARVSANVVREFVKVGGLAEVIQAATQAIGTSSEFFPAHCALSTEQQAAASTLRNRLGTGFSVTVLDGVTGSGKTEVYFDAIEECIRKNRQALVMLPEIALSVQWFTRFEKRFGFAPHIWHSSVTPAKRRACWREVAEGSARVVVGARSALFLPFKDLAIIVADEEHDASYKQEEGVIYHARDMAVVRARHEGIPAVLVSATPSLETEFNIENKRYTRVHLPVRHNAAEMPRIHLIDMRRQETARDKWISEPLKAALEQTLAAGNQAMVFMNRRGYAPLVLCRGCGHRFQCPHCTAWLVLHRSRNGMLCHHCGHSAPLPKECPECKKENTLIPFGPGVERIAEELKNSFPDARVELMTSDSVVNNASDIINDMINHKINILVGTQMVAKGHHFAGLALVGVVDADMGLAGGDLRAGERTYQLLHQLAGRAGREKTKGEVYLQTYMPEHPVMQALRAGERDRFMQLEAQMREDAAMPPYGKLASVIIEGENDQDTVRFAREIAILGGTLPPVSLRETCAAGASHSALPRIHAHDLPAAAGHRPLILGPAPAPLARLKNRYRYRILIKAGRSFPMQQFLERWLPEKVPHALKLKVDVEPYSFV